MNRLCGGGGGRAGLGGRGGCEEELKTVVYFVVAVCVKVEKIGGMAACGEAAGQGWRAEQTRDRADAAGQMTDWSLEPVKLAG